MWFGRKSELEVLEQMDPSRIYVENVRSFMNVKKEKAQKVCDLAERRGILEKWVGYQHPDYGHIVAEHRLGWPKPQEPVRDIQSEQDFLEKQDYFLEELEQVIFYRAPQH